MLFYLFVLIVVLFTWYFLFKVLPGIVNIALLTFLLQPLFCFRLTYLFLFNFLLFYLCRVFTFLVGACAAVFQLCRRRGQRVPSEEDAIGKSSSTCHGCQGLCPSCPSLPTGVSLTCFFLYHLPFL